MDTRLFLRTVFILCMLTAGLDSQIACPMGFVAFENSCYYFGRRERTWADASEQCTNLCGYLVHITSQEENDFLVNRIRMDNRAADHWIGLTDESTLGLNTTEGNFVLASSPMFPLEFTDYNNWQNGEPNNGGGNQNCVHLWAEEEFRWDDDTCTDEKLFICEKDGGTQNTCVNRQQSS